jgi:hypothetical protein
MSDTPKVIEVYRGHHVSVDTPFMLRWEREYRHTHWVELGGKFYPIGTVVDPKTRTPVIAPLPPVRRLR